MAASEPLLENSAMTKESADKAQRRQYWATVWRQTWALSYKCGISFRRTWFWIVFRAFIFPVAFMWVLGYARNLFTPGAEYGVAEPAPVRTVAEAIGDRDFVYYMENGTVTPEVRELMMIVTEGVPPNQVIELDDPIQLLNICKQNLRGSSNCLGAVQWNTFNPTLGFYNYTLRADVGMFGVHVNDHNSDVERYLLPVQWGVDSAILGLDQAADAPDIVAYTSRSQAEHEQDIRVQYMRVLIQYMSPAMFIAMIGIVYHLCGVVAYERELGLSTLLESMGCTKMARHLSFFISFSGLYLPGWIIVGIAVGRTMFYNTDLGTIIIFHVLNGLANVSFALFLSQPFRQAQLSGIISTGVCVMLAIMTTVQSTMHPEDGGAAGALGFVFPPMNYVYYMQTNARFERAVMPLHLGEVPPTGVVVPAVFWLGAIVQIPFYLFMGMAAERVLYGTHSRISAAVPDAEKSLSIKHVSKIYHPFSLAGLFQPRKKLSPVIAVNDLDVSFRAGEISCLLGANGSGKTTTLEMIAGIQKPTEGVIEFGTTTSLGICPQKNVLWDELTVEEHVRVWGRVKGSPEKTLEEEVAALVVQCDLQPKRKFLSKALSGGQKRKLQLAAMFVGDSKVCCIDEVSSGLDPLSRRRIWDILLASRGERSLVLTTHFLDEADLLADHIAILARGVLKASGSPVELKEGFGNGYRVFSITPGSGREMVYEAENGAQVTQLVTKLENAGHKELRVSGPQLEDVFLKLVADSDSEIQELLDENDVLFSDDAATEKSQPPSYGAIYGSTSESSSETNSVVDEKRGLIERTKANGLDLKEGKIIGMWGQIWTMIWKRVIVARRHPLPVLGMLFLPIIVGGITMIFVRSYNGGSCNVEDNVLEQIIRDLSPRQVTRDQLHVVAGPSPVDSATAAALAAPYLEMADTYEGTGNETVMQILTYRNIVDNITLVETRDQFMEEIRANYSTVTPGGVFLDPPTVAFRANGLGVVSGPLMMTVLDNVRGQGNAVILTDYSPFQYPWIPAMGDTLQFVIYFCLAMGAYPAFAALYPTMERIQHVRALHYSNGLRVMPLWTAYLLFDAALVFVSSVVCVIIFGASNPYWYGLGYLFLIMLLYGIASVLFAFVISLIAATQLAAFALTAAFQCIYFLVYLIAYLAVNTFAPALKTDEIILKVHFTLAAVAPMPNLIKGLFLSLNLFTEMCDGEEEFSYYGNIRAFGGPILYLILQSMFYYGILLWWDSGRFRLRLNGRFAKGDLENKAAMLDEDLAAEIERVDHPECTDGLRVSHLSKRFGKFVAVEDVSFAVARGECFALLGPNGAGKSTTFNMIRGELIPSAGGVFVEDVSVNENRAHARTHLGVCPQFDAIDQMNVLETLTFYAKLRGLSGDEVKHNVQALIRAVGLSRFSRRMAAKLSGGNRRKLSLGIALMANPSVLLLDEPSSGMDAASKRVMWRTLANVAGGRSIVLTTHSMEEADALCSRAGILAKNLLAVGTSDRLRERYGDAYYLSFLCTSGVNATEEQMQSIVRWAEKRFAGHAVRVEDKMYHGQVKLAVRTTAVGGRRLRVSEIFQAIEDGKEEMGVIYYAVSQASLEQVFLRIVGDHNVVEEGYEQ
ncbi:uncharacterized protein V1518DRAFT_384962 [Limtongia smithiae]|uniref:uncharacterized protein n=1 Tax=Limtongia smithiae TaxID=1125753 RepID=UPI0034CDB1FF